MTVFENMIQRGHEQVNFFSDPNSGLNGIVAIHNTTLGPSLGGCRMWQYESEEAALVDVLRLSKGMTYKAAISGLNLGGGKAVILGNSKKEKSETLFRSFGRFVEGLGGRYITAEDVGTSVKDMEWVRTETNHVTGISRALGGSGDPSIVTAYGVYIGMKAAVKAKLDKDSLEGLKIAVQGLGHVGMNLANYLYKDGAKLFVTDIDQKSVEKAVKDFNAIAVGLDKIYELDIDVFAPCALGAVLNDITIPKLKCSIIAGAANNQLEKSHEHGKALMSRGILVAPDYVINAGGLINVSNELEGYNRERAFNQAEGIYDTLMAIFKRSQEADIPTNIASDYLAEERIRMLGDLKSIYTSSVKKIRI
ncbi:MAG: leucine dehydrogenase [Candidatus Marinimicrobia bacterium]|nr:leucine dehydrogenase [Candidatus Neomarinimicrobiota bacterium]